MKKTGTLKVLGDMHMPFNKIVLNPNDGYDLDILSNEIIVKVHACVSVEDFNRGDGFLMEGVLIQDNTCRMGVVEINLKTHVQIGKPDSVVLLLSEKKLLIIER